MASSIEILNLAKAAFNDNKPTAMVYQNAAQSIPTGSTFSTVVTWDTTTNDNWNGHSSVTNPSRYTFQVAGLYSLNANLTYSNSAGLGVRALALQVNGSILNGAQTFNQSYSNNFLNVSLANVLYQAAVGDYVEANTWQNSGGALSLVSNRSFMSVMYIHA